MFEIYLISILDGIKTAICVILFLFGSASAFSFICTCVLNNICPDCPHHYYSDDQVRRLTIGNSIFKIVFPIFLLLLFINAFIPSTKQAYTIFGIGGTIEYLKDNKTAKQLPDKAVLALDKWLDSVSDTTNVKY